MAFCWILAVFDYVFIYGLLTVLSSILYYIESSS